MAARMRPPALRRGITARPRAVAACMVPSAFGVPALRRDAQRRKRKLRTGALIEVVRPRGVSPPALSLVFLLARRYALPPAQAQADGLGRHRVRRRLATGTVVKEVALHAVA